MSRRAIEALWWGLVALCLSAACDDSGSSSHASAQLPPPEPVWALGVITAVDSITVNGVRYETDATIVTVNGHPAAAAELELGQVVTVEGTIHGDGLTGTADRVDFEAVVVGPVERVDPLASRLFVMGQTVLIDDDTVFDVGIDPYDLSGLEVGSIARVSGFSYAGGDILATRIEHDPGATRVQVIGRVSGLDLENMLLTVNRLTVDFRPAMVIDVPGGMPVDGEFVTVRGTLTDGILVADELHGPFAVDGRPGERVQAEGVVTRFHSPTDFDLNGRLTMIDASTAFINGTFEDLAINARVTVDGESAPADGTLLAHWVTVGRVTEPTATVTYDFSEFNQVSVFSVFNVKVIRSTEFSVRVNVDAGIANHLDVTQVGSKVSIGLQVADNNARTLEAVVTLPVLERIDLDGVVRVNVNGFEQPRMEADVSGVSHLEGHSLTLGDVNARVSGLSRLDFGDIRPLGGVDIELAGVSTATLNMEAGSSMTGSVEGESKLLYFGTNVNISLTTDPGAVVTKLGESRP